MQISRSRSLDQDFQTKILNAHHFLSSESDQFKDELNSDKSDREIEQDEWEKSEESDSDTSERQEDSYADLEHDTLRETLYIEQCHEELGEVCAYVYLYVYICVFSALRR